MNQRISCAAGLAVIVLAGAPAFAVENKDVRVVNTPAEAIPVNATGTVALAQGTQVGVAGPVSLTPDTQVSLTPGTQVGVANTAANPLHVVAATAVPEVFVRDVDIEFDEDATSSIVFIDVPPGKRWVIEHVSGYLDDEPGLNVAFSIEPRSSGHPAVKFKYWAEGRSLSDPSKHHYYFSAPLRTYHHSDITSLRVRVSRSEGPPGATGRVTVSGYLIDLP